MIFTIRDIELLRLLRWCRYIDPGDLSIFDERTVTNLAGLRLIRFQRSTKYLILTGKGNEFLEARMTDLPERMPVSYKKHDALRRTRVSQISLTAYQAGMTVFTTGLQEFEKAFTFFLPTLMRTNSANPWSNSRIAALLRLGNTLYAAHYVCPGIGELLLADELNAFMNNTGRIGNVRRAFFFVGESFSDILAELDRPCIGDSTRYVSYADAFRLLDLPVHLLPCDETGAMQLRLMALPDYRQRLSRAALKGQYAPAPPDVPAWDAMYEGKPFVVAADMELKRIDAAIQAAQEKGLAPIAMIALKPQFEAVLKKRYREKGLARVFTLKDDMLQELGASSLYVPPLDAYRTEKGEVIDAPLIQAARRTGGSGNQQIRRVV